MIHGMLLFVSGPRERRTNTSGLSTFYSPFTSVSGQFPQSSCSVICWFCPGCFALKLPVRLSENETLFLCFPGLKGGRAVLMSLPPPPPPPHLPVWNLRAVIWFHLSVAAPLFFCQSCCSFCLLLVSAFGPAYFRDISLNCFSSRDRLFVCIALVF